MRKSNAFISIILLGLFTQLSCTSVDLFEKTATIPGHSWKNSFQPSFTFNIKDTTATYQLYFILRHNDKYNFNNIYVNLYFQSPGQLEKQVRIPFPLANNEQGWLGIGMDDIYEHRIPFRLDPAMINFKQVGEYKFRVEQIMREDPLQNVLNAGIRVEKKR